MGLFGTAERRRWFADGLAFECQQCGRCCTGAPGFVWVSREEVSRLAAALGLPASEFDRLYLRRERGRLCLTERANYDCVLLDPATRTCRAYDARPTQCRTWPWWPENLRSQRTWRRARRECPGIDCGPRHPARTIEEQLVRDRQALAGG
jgi:Fe-S-cluster containining protein